MCGRFVRRTNVPEAAEAFGAQLIETDLGPSFNIAPRQPIVVVMEAGKRKLVSMQWGLVPRWSKDEKMGDKMINARAETIAEKPSFRDAFKSRRCLIVADGFFEWTEKDGKKHPLYIYLKGEEPFGMAGIYETWTSPEGKAVTTCAIVTTEANEFMKALHHRMPVIIDPANYDRWLDPQNCDLEGLKALMKPRGSDDMAAHDVNPAVNSPRFNGPECIRPA